VFEFPIRPKRVAIGGTIIIAIAVSCLGIVRAQRLIEPAGGVSYGCSSGKACVEGSSTGSPYGVYGLSTGGNGVEGRSSAAGRSGVSGVQLGDDGIGVYGESHDTSGKYAALFAKADETATDIFYGYNSATHASCLIDPNSNLTCKGSIEASPSADVVGVMGNSAKDYGVEGVSSSADGVHGVTSSTSGNSGVAGIANGTTGSSYGVYGSSTNGPAIYGIASKTQGVVGRSSSAEGVLGASTSSYGVHGASESAFGVLGETEYGYGLVSFAAAPTGAIFYGYSGDGGFCKIDYDGNESCSGTITGGVDVQTRHRTSTGHRVIAYGSESTSATIEDFGRARIVRGEANVLIQRTFASTIDRNNSYYVFLTPLGDTRGLYVSLKTPSGFRVRETQGGRSNLDFDYRIVAHPADAKNTRLPDAPASERLPMPHPSIVNRGSGG